MILVLGCLEEKQVSRKIVLESWCAEGFSYRVKYPVVKEYLIRSGRDGGV
jgi:hypothetical protein